MPRRFTPSSPRLRRGTLRVPGPDLRRLPVGLDLRAINVAEGLRAAVASGAVLVVNVWVGSPALLFVAFAANLACFCDTGGALRDRIPALLAFTGLAAVLWCGVGLLHDFGLPILLPIAGAIVFCTSMARVWGMRAQAVGNVLTVVVALAVDRPLGIGEAGVLFVSFLVGGAWAILLTIGIWRIYPDRPATRMVASNWRLLARFARDLGHLLDREDSGRLQAFEAHARGHRRAIRDALEETRGTLLASVRAPGPVSPVAARNLLMLESQDRMFGALIALSDMLEYAEDPLAAPAARAMLRRLRPLLETLGRGALERADRLEPIFARMTGDADRHPAVGDITTVLVERLRVAYRLNGEEDGAPLPEASLASRPTVADLVTPLRANLTWSSAILRHAVRAMVLTVVAVAVSLTWWSVYSHWLVITVALTMQPYFAATWQRALERVGGTLLGAVLGSALAFFPETPLVTSLLMVPLSVIGFSVRQVSYGAYVACLTPLVVILFEVAEPGHGAWMVASMRSLYTVGGGIVAVLACTVLWPSWEPDRTAQSLREALKAHAAYAAAIFAALSATSRGAPPDEVERSLRTAETARRAAGVASNNLEASLSRALQEPGRSHARKIEVILAADAGLRRLGGALLALQHDSHARDGIPAADWTAWVDWVPAALERLAGASALAGLAHSPPQAPALGTLARVARVIDVLDDIVAELPDDIADGAARGEGGRAQAPDAARATAGAADR